MKRYLIFIVFCKSFGRMCFLFLRCHPHSILRSTVDSYPSGFGEFTYTTLGRTDIRWCIRSRKTVWIALARMGNLSKSTKKTINILPRALIFAFLIPSQHWHIPIYCFLIFLLFSTAEEEEAVPVMTIYVTRVSNTLVQGRWIFSAASKQRI